MTPPWQILANGLVQGLNIALLGLAFNLVFASARLFHMAFAAVYALPPFVLLGAMLAGWPWWAGVVLAIAAGAGLSILCEVLNHSPLERTQASPALHLIASTGTFIVVIQCIAMIWGSQARSLHPGAHDAFPIWGALLARSQLLNTAVCVSLLIGVYAIFGHTRLGIHFRTLAANPTELALVGVNVRRVRMLLFTISGTLAATASLLNAYDVGFDPYVGLPALLLAVVSTIIGGRSALLGPALGGVLLGVLRSLVVWYLSPQWQDAVTFLLLAVFLTVRPIGLLGRPLRLEAQS